MKKTVTVAALSSLLVLGLAVASQAADAATTTPAVAAGASVITLDGSIRERGVHEDIMSLSNTFGNKATNTSQSGYDSRVQLGLKAQVSPEASGYVKLETGAGNSDTNTWGADTGANSLTEGGFKPNGLNILEAWINYKPGMVGTKVGHMPLALGNKIFFDHTGSGDDAVVVYADPTASTHIGALAIKFKEGAALNANDDLDGYVALATHKFNDNLNIGLNWTYLRGRGDSSTRLIGSTGAVAATRAGDYNLGEFAGDAFGAPDPALAASPVLSAPGNETRLADAQTYSAFSNGAWSPAQSLEQGQFPGLSLSNIGMNVDGKVGPISYMADVEFQFGTIAEFISTVDGKRIVVDAEGWAAKVGGDYDLGLGKVGLVFGYGSGTDQKDLVKELAGTFSGNREVSGDTFINFLTDTNYDTIIAGYRGAIPGAGWGENTNARGSRSSGLSNLTLYQLKGSAKAVCPLSGKDLSLLATASYMQLSEDTYRYVNTTTGKPVMVDNVGTELDMIATWALSPGLSYKVEAAYLFVGDVYETSAKHGSGNNPDDQIFLRHGLELKF